MSKRYRFVPKNGSPFFQNITGRPERVTLAAYHELTGAGVGPGDPITFNTEPLGNHARTFARTTVGPGMVEYCEVGP